jgi:hypothetical protein
MPFISIKNAVLPPQFDFLPNRRYIYVANLQIIWMGSTLNNQNPRPAAFWRVENQLPSGGVNIRRCPVEWI